MSIEYHFENVMLTREEIHTLEIVRKKKSVPKVQVFHFEILRSSGFVDYDRSKETDSFGAPILLTTVHVTDKYLRYRLYRRQLLRVSLWYPIIVAFVTSVITNALLYLTNLLR